MVNNIQLTWKLAWMWRTHRTCNSTVRFSKYKFYNKLLGDLILLRVIQSVTWTQSYIYIYIYLYKRYLGIIPCSRVEYLLLCISKYA